MCILFNIKSKGHKLIALLIHYIEYSTIVDKLHLWTRPTLLLIYLNYIHIHFSSTSIVRLRYLLLFKFDLNALE